MRTTIGQGRRLLLALAIAASSAAACGDSDDAREGSEETTTSQATEDRGDAVTAGQCAEDVPDCEDTEVVDDSAKDDGRGADSATGMPANGGLTVSEALDGNAAGASGPLVVRGHLYDEGAGPALCETLVGGGERYICEGPLLPLEGLDLESIRDDVIIHDGLTYTEVEITTLGEIIDGTFVVDPDLG